ncbi:class I SAM-dependent methyltransferase [Fodinicola acaciae]|uniref:class I SAM-dependent methyltransferase n=1 Tax=Fodinicola acaciae TaxID=2681555 RepID=UPI0013D87C27|nr:class I SAM-dependent methyltransferase [Fodinicola acaciae]
MTMNVETYGGDWAQQYDRIFPDGPGVDETVAALVAYAWKSGAERPRALELGTGTGRIAIPLAERGIRVHGIDLEPAMLDVLRSKGVPENLTCAVGDMTDATTFGDGPYDLVFCVFTTISALPDADAQKRCVAAAASVLGDDGRLVLEVQMPRLASFDADGRRVRHIGAGATGPMIETARLDPVSQVMSSEITMFTPDGVRVQPVWHRFLWPSELDLMAELAGLRRVALTPGWQPGAFTPHTSMYVAEYVRKT